MSIRVALIDGDANQRYGRRLALDATVELEVVFESDSMTDTLQRFSDLLVDVALIDLGVRGGNGLELIQRLSRQADTSASTRFVLTAPFKDDAIQVSSISAGADELISLDDGIETLVSVLRRSRDQWIKSEYQRVSALLLRKTDLVENFALAAAVTELTPEERLTVKLLLEGVSEDLMAARLGQTLRQLRARIQKILSKLGFSNRPQLTLAVMQAGLKLA